MRDIEQIVGREAEVESLERFIISVDAWPGAFVIEGAAGIGKSTLLEAAAAVAKERSCGVLRCGPGDRESRFSFAALRDLLDGVYDEVAARLPVPQRRALAIALLREEPDVPLDRGAVSEAFLTLLRERSRAGSILLVVDDVQWLDPPTATAVEFAVRRLRQEPVGILLARRSDEGGSLPLGLDRSLAPERLQRLSLGPLSLGALQAMLRTRLGRSFPRPVLRRIYEASGGNPFFALEIAMALEGDDAPGPGAALPIPSDIRELLRGRIESLAPDTRTALLVASASSEPTLGLIAAATGSGDGSAGVLEPAERTGVIEIQRGQIHFTHPLLASTVYVTASPTDRRAAHRALAGCAIEPEERARHLALSSNGPDPAIAAALDDAARTARARGAPDSAAELADLARQLTSPDDTEDIFRRGVEAAGRHFDAGNAVRAQELFAEMAETSPPGPVRAEILWRLADASWNETDLVRSHLERGLEDVSGDLRLECGIRWDLAWTWVYGGDLTEAERQARWSLAIAERLGDASLMPEALAAVGICEFLLGRDGGEKIARAASLQVSGSIPDTYTTPRLTLVMRQMWAGELDAARSTLEPVLDHLANQGLYTLATEPIELLSEIECRAGRYRRSRAACCGGDRGQARRGVRGSGGTHLLPAGTRRRLPRGPGVGPRIRGTGSRLVRAARGPLLRELPSRGARLRRAVPGTLRRSRPALPTRGRIPSRDGGREPGVIPVMADAIEARIGIGDLDGAHDLLVEFEEQGRTSGRPWALATAARCEGAAPCGAGGGRGDPAGLPARARRSSPCRTTARARAHTAREGRG